MKKIILICICIVVIAAVGIGIVRKAQEPRSGIEKILPQNVSFFVQLHDVESNFKKLASMPIWEGLSHINLNRLVEKNAVSSQQAMFLTLAKEQLSAVLTNPLAKRIFGHDVALAIYPLESDIDLLVQEMKALNPQFIEELLSGLFLVTRVDRDVQFAEFVSRYLGQLGADISQGQVEYKGEIIRTITITEVGVKFGMVRLGDLLVIGIGDKAARKSVDTYKGDVPSLVDDPQYLNAQSQSLKPYSMIGYINFTQFIEEFQDEVDKLVSLKGEVTGNTQAQDQWEQVLARLAGIKAFAFSSQLSPIIRFDNRLVFDPSELDPVQAPIYTCPSGENKTLQFTPKEVLGYHWNNCFKLDYYWKQITRELKRTNTPDSRIDEFETNIGLSVERDILPAFGEEIGGYLQDIQAGGLFPIPKILFFVEVDNRDKAQAILNKLEEQPLVMFQSEDHNGVLVKHLGLPLGQDLQPGYAFLGKHLLISTSRGLLHDSIDAHNNPALSLQSNPDFQEIDFGLTDPNRSVQFFKTGAMMERTKGVIEWSNQWVTARDRKAEAFKAGSSKPLEEVMASIALREGELEEIRRQLVIIEDEIWNMESKGLDASSKKAEIDDIKQQIDAKKEEIVAENERKEGLASIVEEFDDGSKDSELRQFYLDELVYPILNSLKYIKSFGLRTTVNNNAFDSSLLMKVIE